MGIGTFNLISTTGSYMLAIGFAVALASLLWSSRYGRPAPNDPWQGGTLEWSLASPPPSYGFRSIPVVRDLYPLWPVASGKPSVDPEAEDHYTRELNRVEAAMDCRPAAWRGTLVTDGINGRPLAVQSLPGPTLLPFWVAVVVTLATVFFLAQYYQASALAAMVALGMSFWWISREPVYDREEADMLVTRLRLPLLTTGKLSTGWCGLVGFLAVLFTVLAALIFSYFYLRLYSQQWPQGDIPLPQLGSAAPIFALLACAGVALLFSAWGWRHQRRTMLRLGMTASILLAIIFFCAQIRSLAAEPFLPSTNAYASIFLTLNGFVLLLTLVGVCLLIGTLARVIRKKDQLLDTRLVLWLQNSEMFFFFSVFSGLCGFLILYLVPHLL